MTMGASQVCRFCKSDSSRATPNLQFVQPISTDILGASKLHDFHGITPTVATRDQQVEVRYKYCE